MLFWLWLCGCSCWLPPQQWPSTTTHFPFSVTTMSDTRSWCSVSVLLQLMKMVSMMKIPWDPAHTCVSPTATRHAWVDTDRCWENEHVQPIDREFHWLVIANALNCKSSGQGLTPGCDRVKDYFSVLPCQHCVVLSVPVSPSCARHILSLLHMFKDPNIHLSTWDGLANSHQSKSMLVMHIICLKSLFAAHFKLCKLSFV